MQKKSQILGAHISIAQGFAQTVQIAEKIGANAFQIFSKSNRQWHAKPLTNQDTHSLQNSLEQAQINPHHVVVHASYLINVGSQKPEIQYKAVTALTEEIKRCKLLRIPFLVLHPGTRFYKDSVEDSCKFSGELIGRAIQEANAPEVMILLENMAGQGNSIGSHFQELALIASATQTSNIGFCIDTCHAFTAGYDFRTPQLYAQFWKTIEKYLGKENIRVLHINDSKKPFSSRKDRHEEIGKGEIGPQGFRLLMNDLNLISTIKIIETPKQEPIIEDARNIQTLLSYIKK